MPSTPIEVCPQFVDAKMFVEWLESEGVTRDGLSANEARKWDHWKSGHFKTVDTYASFADRLVMDNGLRIEDLPREAWHKQRPDRRRA